MVQRSSSSARLPGTQLYLTAPPGRLLASQVHCGVECGEADGLKQGSDGPILCRIACLLLFYLYTFAWDGRGRYVARSADLNNPQQGFSAGWCWDRYLVLDSSYLCVLAAGRFHLALEGPSQPPAARGGLRRDFSVYLYLAGTHRTNKARIMEGVVVQWWILPHHQKALGCALLAGQIDSDWFAKLRHFPPFPSGISATRPVLEAECHAQRTFARP